MEVVVGVLNVWNDLGMMNLGMTNLGMTNVGIMKDEYSFFIRQPVSA